MDIELQSLLVEMQRHIPELLSSYCIVNGAITNLEEIQKMGYREFSLRSKLNMPLKLYRYYPNRVDEKSGNNYSLQALRDNTVFLQSPFNFDDIYDSEINIDFDEYQQLRLTEYCRRCGVNYAENASTQELLNNLAIRLWECSAQTNDLNSAFIVPPSSELEALNNENFRLTVLLELRSCSSFAEAIAKALWDEYNRYVKELKTAFRTTCFATTPYSQLMWGGSYADESRGFCLEYTVLPTDEAYEEVFYSLFPMIYCKVRPDMTKKLVEAKEKKPTMETMWDIYFHGVLRKGIDWAFQNEWRLLLPLRSENIADYNVKFFPITKVFLGNRMPAAQRKEIIDICHEKNIPYVGVKKNPNFFEMQDCEMKCEDCPSLQTH